MGLRELALEKCSESDVNGNINMEEKETKDCSSVTRIPAVGESNHALFEKENLKMLRRQRLIPQLEENFRNINLSFNQMETLDLKADKIPEKYHRIKKHYGKLEIQLNQMANTIDQFQRRINHMKNFLRERGIPLGQPNTHLVNRKQTPSEVVKSIESSDCFEYRRNQLRKEVSATRRNNQSRITNFNRGLPIDEDAQESSESDRMFDLSSLDEALPPASRGNKKAPGVRRSLKLHDIIINNMKENRAVRHAAVGLLMLSEDATTAEKSS